MSSAMEPAAFSGADYGVFGGLLLISAAIGVYYAWKDRNEKDVDAYLVGKRQMSPIPVAISLCVSYVSGIMMVGMPTQIYNFGVVIIWYSAICFIGPFITGLYFIPLFFRLDIMSVYEILEMRFGKVSRLCASSSILILMIIYMGMVTYVPCLSLSAVSDASMTLSIILTCSVCTFYTTLGGIKAVIWTDVVQAGVMVLGQVSVIVKTTNHLGGISNVTAALERSDRLNFVEWSFDPYIRYSTWTIILGLPVVWIMMSAVNQPMVQRYLSCKNVTQARIAVWIFLIPQQVFFFLSFFTGVVMAAYYETCDPMISGATKLPDQALPYMVVNVFQDMPGLAGIFIAAVYSGTLSTVSSGISALSAVVLSDFILKAKPQLANKSLLITKFLVFILGVVVLCMTFIISALGKLVVDLFFTIFGSIGGPLMGVYTLAIFIPWSNEKGAVAGHLTGTIFSFWVSIGQIIYPPPDEKLQLRPISVSGCPVPDSNTTGMGWSETITYTTEGLFSVDYTATTAEAASTAYRPAIADSLYAISNNYIGPIGFIVCMVVGIIISGLTGFEDPKYANTDIFVPFFDNKYLPKSVVKFFRLGVPVRQRIPDEDEEQLKSKDQESINL